jgi:hypothetical protein
LLLKFADSEESAESWFPPEQSIFNYNDSIIIRHRHAALITWGIGLSPTDT